MKAGAGQVEITPTNQQWMAGFGARKRKAKGTHDPLYAKTLVLAQGSERAAIVTLDLCSFPDRFAARLKRRIEEEARIPRENVLFNASHTHFSPILSPSSYLPDGAGPDRVWLRELEEKVTDTVCAAGRGAVETRVTCATGRLSSIAGNRRGRLSDGRVVTTWGMKPGEVVVGPGGPADPDVPVLHFTNRKNQPLATFFSYACHPTLGDIDEDDRAPAYLYSGSYVGYAMKHVQEAIGGVALFGQGCGANINPMGSHTWKMRYSPSFREAERMGVALGKKVVSTLKPQEGSGRRTDILRVANRKAVLRRRRDRARGPGGQTLSVAVQGFRIGDVILMALPSELVVEVGLGIKAEYGGENLIVLGYSNRFCGYIPTRKIASEGGYEAVNSRVEPESANILKDTSLEIINDLLRQ